MIAETDNRISKWAGTIVPEVGISLNAPPEAPGERAVSLYLLDLINTPASRGTKRPPLQITLRYLVTASSARPEEAHDLIGELMFAAMEHQDMEVERDAPSLELWRALHRAPQPAFFLRVPLRQQRPEPEVKLVTKPPVFKTSRLDGSQGVGSE